ncbi:DUF6626 family protein [Methylobacterium sp. JK268]
MILNEIREVLIRDRTVRSTAEYCREYLGCERSYCRGLVARRARPSVDVLVRLARALDARGRGDLADRVKRAVLSGGDGRESAPVDQRDCIHVDG